MVLHGLFYWLNLKQKGGGFPNWTVIVATITYAPRNFSLSHPKAIPSLTGLALGALCCNQRETA